MQKYRELLLIVVVALALRLLVMAFLYPEQLSPERDHWKFGYETGRIARSIVEGKGFSNPLFEETGPTAWMTPVYPCLVAGVFKIFGVYTKASALVLLSLNALMSALAAIPIFFFARRSFGERVGRWSAWTWAFFPYGIYFPVERIWETWLATLLLSILFLMALELEESKPVWVWILYGFLWGVEALTSPSVLAVLPFLGGWTCYRLYRKRQRWFVPNVAAALVCLAVVSPWFIRNYQVFHQFVPFRDNMGLVLRLGTKGNTSYWGVYELGPWHNEAEWQEFKRDGELGYMATKKRQAVAFIKAEPGWYVWTSFRRAVFLWTGYWSLAPWYLKQEPLDPPNILLCTSLTVLALLGLRRAFRKDSALGMPYALVLFSFPLVYYITSPEVYYRRPIDPMFVVLAVYAIVARGKLAAPPKEGVAVP
ncbi:MAG: glycosyltransferase family 39 protein [Acidobacteriales bacterium]|nr:glycosyltransferase family 39 protein [Terriglobales bacterium]